MLRWTLHDARIVHMDNDSAGLCLGVRFHCNQPITHWLVRIGKYGVCNTKALTVYIRPVPSISYKSYTPTLCTALIHPSGPTPRLTHLIFSHSVSVPPGNGAATVYADLSPACQPLGHKEEL